MKASRRALIVAGAIEGTALILALILFPPSSSPALDRMWWTFHEPATRILDMVRVVLPKDETFVAVLLVQFLFWMAVFGAAFWLVDLCRKRHARTAEPGASPNGGPAEQLGNSGVGGGPPSVS
jgi:hypothetical protein